MALIYPSIPDPTNNSDSLVTTVRALKQAVEQLTGQRNNGPAAHIFSQTARPTAIAVGDVWIDKNSIARYWAGTDWLNLSLSQRGTYYSTVTQSVASTTAEQAITYNVTSLNGVSLSGNSQIVLPTPGDYLLIFSAECYNTDVNDQTLDIWLRKNGSGYVTDTNTRTFIPKSFGYVPATVNFIVTSTATTDYYELMMCGSHTVNTGIGVVAASASAPARPSAPSIIVTVNRLA